MKHQLICTECAKPFTSGWKTKKCCSSACARKAYAVKVGIYSPYRAIPSGTVGAIQELRVSADLMTKGYAVFRALSPSCKCDLAILKDEGQVLKVEVTTGYRNNISGRICHPKNKIYKFWDVLAICLKDQIIYEPELF